MTSTTPQAGTYGAPEKKKTGADNKPGSVPRQRRGNGHSSGTPVARGLVQPTRKHESGQLPERPGALTLPYLALLRMGFTELPRSPGILVSSYLTVSPLPLRAVCFLWHFPWGRPQSPLATILPCGARTFLCSAFVCAAATILSAPAVCMFELWLFFAQMSIGWQAAGGSVA